VNAGVLLAPSADRGRHLRIAVAATETWFREQPAEGHGLARTMHLWGESCTSARTNPTKPRAGHR
jgi:hypothetical protein